jgi:hypothetical protein
VGSACNVACTPAERYPLLARVAVVVVTGIGKSRLVWVRDRDLVRGSRELQQQLLGLAERCGEFVRPLPWF